MRITAHRSSLRGRRPTRPGYLVVLVHVVAALALTWPLAGNFGTHLPAVAIPYDALMHVFLLGWGWQGLTTHPLEVFNAPIFYPETRTLTYMDHMLGQAVLAGPVIEIFGLAAAYNSLILLSFVASGYFVYRLALLYGISPAGGCLAGFLFAFCPYRFSHLGCLNQSQTQLIPLGIFFAVSFLRSGRTVHGVGAAVTLAAQSYFGWYTTFHLLVALLALLGWEALREPGRWRRLPWPKMVALAVLSGVLVAPSALPYVFQSLAMPEFRHPFSETIRLSADLVDYLRLNPDNVLVWLFPWLGRHWSGLFPGLVATALAAVAMAALLRTRATARASGPHGGRRGLLGRARAAIRSWGEAGYLPILLFSGLVLSLGPILKVAGHKLWVPLPYPLFYYLIPGFPSMRTPARFAVLVALATALLAGLGFDTLRRRFPRPGPALVVGTLLVAGALAWSPTLPFVAFPDRASMPPVYEWLAAQPDSDPVLELPAPARFADTTDARRQVYVLYHLKPRLDGESGFTSDRYKAFRREMQAFPAPEALGLAYRTGARRLIVHYGDWAPARGDEIRQRVKATKALRQVAAFGQDVVYEIEGLQQLLDTGTVETLDTSCARRIERAPVFVGPGAM